MDIKLFKLLNKARTEPSSFAETMSTISFNNNKALIGLEQWDTELTPENITELKSFLINTLNPIVLANFTTDHPLALSYPPRYPMILIAIHLCLQFRDTIFDPNLCEISISLDSTPELIGIKLCFQYQLTSNTMSLGKKKKTYQEKARKIAYEIVQNPRTRKQFRVMMLEGNEWITALANSYGPFTGYELNEFISWFKNAEKEIPKKKKIPIAKDPKPPVLSKKIVVYEGGVNPEGSVVINKPNNNNNVQNIFEATTNSFCNKAEESVKFTFRAKQRYNDIKDVLKNTNGNASENIIFSLPEKECEEIIKEPPISVPEKYEAFLLEEVLITPAQTKVEVAQKPMFSTNFRLPDNLKVKTETAKEMMKHEINLLNEPYVHKFREDFDPKAVNKPDFILRLPKNPLPQIERISEPLEKLKNIQKQEKMRIEMEEKKKRTELYGKTRDEWVSRFKTVSSLYEVGTGSPHKLLPKDEYIETYKIQSRAS